MLEASGQEFLKCIPKANEWESGAERPRQPLHKALLLYKPSFQDREETVIIIDEIQESPTVYNLIREFTRNFHCRFIVTGSYLGRTLNTKFKLSAGDLKSLRIETLDFEEFTEAFGLHEVYAGMGLYGTQHLEKKQSQGKRAVRNWKTSSTCSARSSQDTLRISLILPAR